MFLDRLYNIKKITKITVFARFSKTFNQNVWNTKGFQKKNFGWVQFFLHPRALRRPSGSEFSVTFTEQYCQLIIDIFSWHCQKGIFYLVCS